MLLQRSVQDRIGGMIHLSLAMARGATVLGLRGLLMMPPGTDSLGAPGLGVTALGATALGATTLVVAPSLMSNILAHNSLPLMSNLLALTSSLRRSLHSGIV